MNKKGFTLIELLMVITLIGILSLILVPNVMSLNNKNKIKSCNSLKNNIISAAKVYVTNYRDELGFTCSFSKDISAYSLINSESLSGPVVNPMNKKKLNDYDLKNIFVEVTYDCRSKSFSYVYKDDNNIINCS